MKKLVLIIFVVILLGTILSSCKVHHSCDAYPHHAMLINKSQKNA